MSSRKTRSGRTIKKPERWEPEEECTDDFKPDEYDTDDNSDVSSKISLSEDEEEPDSDDDGFIVQDSDEEDDDMYEETDDEDEEEEGDYDSGESSE